LGLVGVLFGSLETTECHSKYGIRIFNLLGGVSFGFVHWCSAYIRHICYVVSLLPVSVRLVQRPSYNNIFAVQKKNNNVRSIDVGTQNLATLRAGESNQNIHRTD
jgi:hypothetical protein